VSAPAHAQPTLPASASVGDRVAELFLFGLVPASLLAFMLGVGHEFGFDFHQFWQGGRDVLHGASPYPPRLPIAGRGSTLGPHEIQEVFRFPYPAGSAFAMVPFALLPFHVAAIVLAALSVLAVVLALRLLDVRDWRCYGLALSCITTITAVRLGTLTPFLLLALALAWRYRDQPLVSGAALGAAVVLKVFLWPLAIWLIATRRFAAAAAAAAMAIGVTVISWAALGFAGFAEYPTLVHRLADTVSTRGFSLVALSSDLGLGRGGYAVTWAVGGVLLVGVLLVARGRDGDRRSFALAVMASLLLTPIVWLHYFVLLYGPISLWRRSLAGVWLVPFLFWATPFQETDGAAWRVALGLIVALAAVTAGALLRPAPTEFKPESATLNSV
jgi:hypothetical protein